MSLHGKNMIFHNCKILQYENKNGPSEIFSPNLNTASDDVWKRLLFGCMLSKLPKVMFDFMIYKKMVC